MAQKTISIADKPTLDEVKTLAQSIDGKCDEIYNAVQSGGGGGVNLNKIHVFILDTANDEVVMQYGAADKYGHRIQT